MEEHASEEDYYDEQVDMGNDSYYSEDKGLLAPGDATDRIDNESDLSENFESKSPRKNKPKLDPETQKLIQKMTVSLNKLTQNKHRQFAGQKGGLLSFAKSNTIVN